MVCWRLYDISGTIQFKIEWHCHPMRMSTSLEDILSIRCHGRFNTTSFGCRLFRHVPLYRISLCVVYVIVARGDSHHLRRFQVTFCLGRATRCSILMNIQSLLRFDRKERSTIRITSSTNSLKKDLVADRKSGLPLKFLKMWEHLWNQSFYHLCSTNSIHLMKF